MSMELVATLAFYLGALGYTVAAALFFVDLARPEDTSQSGAWAPRVLLLGGAFHLLHIVVSSLLTRICPVETLHFGLSFSAFVAVAAYGLLYRRARLYATGAIVAPVALTFLVLAQFVTSGDPQPLAPLLMFHIAANVLGIGLFLFAGASGLLYLFQEHRLRRKQTGGISQKLPSLDSLDRATHLLLLAGFPLLTFGVVTGAVFAKRLFGFEGAELARSLLGYATWAVLASVLILRRVAGVRGRRAAYGTLAGLLCVLLVIVVYAARPGGRPS
jgi:ABC-type uncharacterized transport system permease subunit